MACEDDESFLAALYLLFLGMAIWGHVSWRRTMEEPRDA